MQFRADSNGFSKKIGSVIESVRRYDLVSMLTFGDLAGSEKVKKTDAKGLQLSQAKEINRSLNAGS